MSWEQTQTLVTITLAFLVSMASAAAEPVRVLLVHGSPVPSGLDATLKAKLADAGFVTRTARYEQLSQPLLAAFHVVVVMQEPAYGQSFVGEPEREGFRQRAPLLLKFVENGGGLYV
ncbi:MAG: hypothetical protein FJ278_03140, partial [Planctomycetes bacterium]|nr:hypothetical protein [Planctomycetota bacterium]